MLQMITFPAQDRKTVICELKSVCQENRVGYPWRLYYIH